MSYVSFPSTFKLQYSGTPQSPILVALDNELILTPVLSGYESRNYLNYTGYSFGNLNYTESVSKIGPKITYLNFDNLNLISSDITLSGLQSLSSLQLNNLNLINNNLTLIDISTIEKINIPELVYLGNNIIIKNVSSTGISLPKLESVIGDLILDSCIYLTGLNLNNTNSLNSINFKELNRITGISLPSIRYVNDINLNNLNNLKTISSDFDRLAEIRNLQLSNLPLVDSIGFNNISLIKENLNLSLLNNISILYQTGITGIGGNFIISGFTGIFTISFPSLKQINQRFIITGNNKLTGLVNFNQLTGINDNFNILSDGILNYDFTNLTYISGRLVIPSGSIRNFTGISFPNLTKISELGRDVSIDGPTITNIDLRNLSGNIGTFTSTSSVFLTGLNLNSLTGTLSGFSLSNNNLSIVDLPKLKGIGTSLSISSMPLTTGINCSLLEYIGSACTISVLNSLPNINFPALTKIDAGLTISTLPSLTGYNLPVLTGIGGTLTINTTTGLRRIYFPELTRIGSSFTTTSLTITGISLPKLTEVVNTFSPNFGGGSISGFDFPLLAVLGTFSPTNILGINRIVFPSLTGVVGAFSPTTFTDITGFDFPNLTRVAGSFTMTSFPALRNFGFSTLNFIVGDVLFPMSNTGMSIIEFPALTGINGRLYDQLSTTNFVNVTGVSFPLLKRVGLLFAPSFCQQIQELVFPSLEVIGSSSVSDFAPQAISGLRYMSFPSLTGINGSFAPTGLLNLTGMNFPKLGRCNGFIGLSGSPNMIEFVLPNLTGTNGQININGTLGSGLTNLRYINLESLTGINGVSAGSDGLVFNLIPSLTGINLSNLSQINCNFSLSNGNTTSYELNFPSLRFMGPSSASFLLLSADSLNNIRMPLITGNPNFNLNQAQILTGIDAPLLKKFDGFTAANLSRFTNFSFPSLEQIGAGGVSFPINAARNLTGFNLPNLKYIQGNFTIGASSNSTGMFEIYMPSLSGITGNLTIDFDFPNRFRSLNLNNLSTVVGNLILRNYENTTGISLPFFTGASISSLSAIQIQNMPVLQSLSLPRLKNVYSLSIGSGLFSNIDLSALENSNAGFVIYNTTGLNLISLPLLTGISSVFTLSNNSQVQYFNFPTLTEVKASFLTNPSAHPVLTGMNFSKLKWIGGNYSFTGSQITEISFPSLTGISGLFNPRAISGCTGVYLTGMIGYGSGIIIPSGTTISDNMSGVRSLSLGTSGTLKYISGSRIEISGLNLDQTSVNGVLSLLVSLDGTNGTQTWGAGRTLLMHGGNNAAPAGQGITDKTTLQGRGATVLTN